MASEPFVVGRVRGESQSDDNYWVVVEDNEAHVVIGPVGARAFVQVMGLSARIAGELGAMLHMAAQKLDPEWLSKV
jgi:hypothetical protein